MSGTEGTPAPDPSRSWLISEIERRSGTLAILLLQVGNEPVAVVVDQCLAEIAEVQTLLLRLDAGLRGSKVIELVDQRGRFRKPT
jgi:hypothetical protein